MEGKSPDILISDRDQAYGIWMKPFLESMDIIWKRTPYRLPIFNAYAERMVRTFREELTDRLLLYNQNDLENVLAEYVAYYNNARVHSGLDFDAPKTKFVGQKSDAIVRTPVLDGLITDFAGAA